MTLTIDVLSVVRRFLLGLIVTMGLLGGFVCYHFYWPTTVTVDGHRVNRAQLIDWVIDRELQHAQGK